MPLLEFRFDAQQTADYAPVQESALVIVQVEEESLVEEMKQSGVLNFEIGGKYLCFSKPYHEGEMKLDGNA